MRRKYFAKCILFFGIFFTLNSCKSGSLKFCLEENEKFNESVRTARLALKPWERRSQQGRRIASEGEPEEKKRGHVLHLRDRIVWQEWARSRLVEIQEYIDMMEARSDFREMREELSRSAIDLVTFHGYAELGRSQEMMDILERVHARGIRVQNYVCSH